MQMTPDDLKDIIDMDAAAGGGAPPYSWVSMQHFFNTTTSLTTSPSRRS